MIGRKATLVKMLTVFLACQPLLGCRGTSSIDAAQAQDLSPESLGTAISAITELSLIVSDNDQDSNFNKVALGQAKEYFQKSGITIVPASPSSNYPALLIQKNMVKSDGDWFAFFVSVSIVDVAPSAQPSDAVIVKIAEQTKMGRATSAQLDSRFMASLDACLDTLVAQLPTLKNSQLRVNRKAVDVKLFQSLIGPVSASPKDLDHVMAKSDEPSRAYGDLAIGGPESSIPSYFRITSRDADGTVHYFVDNNPEIDGMQSVDTINGKISSISIATTFDPLTFTYAWSGTHTGTDCDQPLGRVYSRVHNKIYDLEKQISFDFGKDLPSADSKSVRNVEILPWNSDRDSLLAARSHQLSHSETCELFGLSRNN